MKMVHRNKTKLNNFHTGKKKFLILVFYRTNDLLQIKDF